MSSIVLDFVLFAVFVNVLHLNPVLATCLSVSVAIVNSFLWNAHFTFKKHDRLLSRFINFYAVGLGGLLASALVLLVASEIFWNNPTIVKLISIPPIVIGQYFLNKHITFGGRQLRSGWLKGWLQKNYPVILLCCLFVMLSLPLVRFTPLTPGGLGAPDEYQHFQKNVEFMLHNHRLPVSGQDDIDSLSTCRNNLYGQVPCLYSYQFTPGFNYVVSAAAAKTGTVFGLGELTGARLAATAWGVVFVVSVYLISHLFLRRQWAIMLTAATAFIPQIIFTASYVNQDIHSLAITGMLVYSSLAYVYAGKTGARWLLYVTFGLLFVTKYNYFIIALVPLGLLVWRTWQQKKWRQLRHDLLYMGAAAAVFSGFWYVRNLVLYNDLLGQHFALQAMAQYHQLGRRLSFIDLESYRYIFAFDALNTLFRSFFAMFGYMTVRLSDSLYTLLQVGLVGGMAALWAYGDRKVRWALAGAAGFVLLALVQVVFNAFMYDFQFQGRYLFVSVPVLVAAIAYCLARVGQNRPALTQGVLLGSVIIMAVVVVNAALVLANNLASIT